MTALEPEVTERPLTDKIEYASNTTKQIDLPRDNLIQEIIMRFTVKATNPAGGITLKEDGILNLVKNVKLIANGKDVLRAVPARIMNFIEAYEGGTDPELVQIGTAVGAQTGTFTLILDFKSDRNDPNDFSALLSALDKSSLKLQVEWGTITDITATANFTVDAGTEAVIELKEVSPVGIDRESLVDIREQVDIIKNDKQYNQFDNVSLPVSISPVPSQILLHAFLGIDNGVRANAAITDVKVQRAAAPKEDRIIRSFAILRQENKREFSRESLVAGFAMLDYINKLGKPIDAESPLASGNPPKEGDFKLRFLTIAPTGTSEIHIFTRYVV